ncbi:MAG: hypothetical protein ACE141_03275 [Bryobacteraceae bacterium]
MAVVIALLALFLIDAAVFRSPLYLSVLDPQSTTGSVEITHLVEARRARAAALQVLAFGDSRMGFLPRPATRIGAPYGVEFSSVAVPGTSPRCWYYQLRDLDPDARRFAAILLPVDDYDDEDRAEDPADSLADLRYAIGRLRLTDVLDFPLSFSGWYPRWVALRGTLFKGTVYKDDLHSFLLAPYARWRTARLYHRDYGIWVGAYQGEEGSVEGLRVDWAARKITYPAGVTTAQQEMFRSVLLRAPAPQTGRLAEYRRKWFGRIVDHYRGTGTRVVFFRLPRGPVVRPGWLVRKRSSSIRELAARPNVVLLDEHTFDSLERTDCFIDPLHLNVKGSELFSRMMAEQIVARLSREQGPYRVARNAVQ